jgi:flagellar motor switch protein FliN/FliY
MSHTKPIDRGQHTDLESLPVTGDNSAAIGGQAQGELNRILDVKVKLRVELGRRRLSIADVLAMGPGSVVEFCKSAEEPLDIFVNDQLIARGEAVVIGERYGIRITEVISPSERLRQNGIAEVASP